MLEHVVEIVEPVELGAQRPGPCRKGKVEPSHHHNGPFSPFSSMPGTNLNTGTRPADCIGMSVPVFFRLCGDPTEEDLRTETVETSGSAQLQRHAIKFASFSL